MNSFLKTALGVALLCGLTFTASANKGTLELVAVGEGNDTQQYALVSPSYSVPVNAQHSLVLRGGLSYLYYEYEEAQQTVETESPGVELGVLWRWTRDRLTLSIGPGYEVRDTEREFANGTRQEETEDGFTVFGSAWYQATPLTTLNLMASYGHANQYTWVRGGIKQQLTNKQFQQPRSLSVGAELTGEGNDDIAVYRVGVLLELAFIPQRCSVQLRVSYPVYRSDDDAGAEMPFLGLGLYKAF